MAPIRFIARRILTALALPALPLGCGGGGTGQATVPPPLDSDPPVLGSVADATGVSCPAGAANGAVCTLLRVSCPRMDDLSVVVAASDSAVTPRATILLHDKLGGTQFFDDGFVDAYHAADFRVVQTQWQSDWEQSEVGLKHAACRYATLLQWIWSNLHLADRTRGFCAQSYGGGSGGLLFSLAHYQAGDILDAVAVSAGPPFARIDLGCDPSTPARTPCPELATAPVAYDDGVLQIIGKWEVAPSCGTGALPAEEVTRWRGDSILSPGAALAYPERPSQPGTAPREPTPRLARAPSCSKG